jgi:hypothetical protein
MSYRQRLLDYFDAVDRLLPQLPSGFVPPEVRHFLFLANYRRVTPVLPMGKSPFQLCPSCQLCCSDLILRPCEPQILVHSPESVCPGS